MDSEAGNGVIGANVDGIGMKSGSLTDLNRKPESFPLSLRVDRSSLAKTSFQSTSPTLVMAAESRKGAPARGPVDATVETIGFGAVELPLGAG